MFLLKISFDTKHYLPENVDEQRKIADFLIALDRRIEAQQSLVDNLKKYKEDYFRTCSVKSQLRDAQQKDTIFQRSLKGEARNMILLPASNIHV